MVAVQLATEHATTPSGQKRLAALQGMDKAYDMADTKIWNLESYKKTQKKGCDIFLGNYSRLAKEAMKKKKLQVQYHPKAPFASLQIYGAM